MRKLSIKARMTLWFSLFILVLVICIFALLAYMSGSFVSSAAQDRLVALVEKNAQDGFDVEDGLIEIEDDFVYANNGVSVAIFDENQRLLRGYLPSGLEGESFNETGKVRLFVVEGQHYYLYDTAVAFEQGARFWSLGSGVDYGEGAQSQLLFLRGVVVADSGSNITGTVSLAAFILLPFIVIVAAVGGYFIAHRSLKPISKITQAANEIGEGSDLSKRIGLESSRGKYSKNGSNNNDNNGASGTKDEVYNLAHTFDRMFERLEASFEEEKRFTADVSHELRTPTAVILSQCEYSLEHAETEEDYREALQTIERQTLRMSHLISQLLAFTRLEQGLEQAHFETVNVSELVRTVCEEQELANNKKIRLQTAIDSGIEAQADKTLFAHLVANLISNAYKYGKEETSIKVSLVACEGSAFLSVADEGIGIEPENLAKIWGRFYQVEPARTASDSSSMGLGLALVEQIARLHKGSLKVESRVGEGSTFTFSFLLSK